MLGAPEKAAVAEATSRFFMSAKRNPDYFPEKSTLGTCCDAGVPSKYALLR